MLGKRKKQFSYPPHKRNPAKYMRTATRSAPNQFGSGYNPKYVKNAPPPPNAELKWHETSNFLSSWNAIGGGLPSHLIVNSLVQIAHGDSGDKRNGQKIMLKKITLRGTSEAYQNSNTTFNSTTPGDVWFRWFLIVDTQANGSAAPLTDVFETNPTGQDTFDLFNSLRSSGRFKVLLDKFVKVNAAAPMYNSTTQHTHVPNRLTHFKKTIGNLNIPISYYDGSDALTSLKTNNVFLVVFNGHDGTNLGINYRVRVRFLDY